MLKRIKHSDIKKMLPIRDPKSHKGMNGRVLIVAGSLDYSGTAILAGLGALHSGADLVTLYVPECNFECTRGFSPDFIVKKYKGDYLNKDAVSGILAASKKSDCVLIGPGLTDSSDILDTVKELLNKLSAAVVLDADAISVVKRIENFPLPYQVVLTPHKNEFANLVDREVDLNENDPKSIILLRSVSMDLHVNILLKGPLDYISSEEGHVEVNKTGNPGMTVGGSGDVLSGVVATLLAQTGNGFVSAKLAAYIVGAAGDLCMQKKGYHFSASDIALALPYVF